MSSVTRQKGRLPRRKTVKVVLEWPLLPWLKRKARKKEHLDTTIRRMLLERMSDDFT